MNWLRSQTELSETKGAFNRAGISDNGGIYRGRDGSNGQRA
jgi:hypothetical protein